MSVRHSREVIKTGLQQRDPFCGICHEVISPNEVAFTSPYNHKFHKACISITLEISIACPVCNSECSVIERLTTAITYRGLTESVGFYIIPDLKQNV